MPKIEWDGDRLINAALQATREVCSMTAEIVKQKSVDLAPLDESTLRGSATATDIKNGAEVSYNTPYAVVMHESENYVPSHPGTGPGYLRQPLLEAEDKFHADVAAAVKGVLG